MEFSCFESLTENELLLVSGGEGNPYGAGANLGNIAGNLHAIADLYHGLVDGLLGR